MSERRNESSAATTDSQGSNSRIAATRPAATDRQFLTDVRVRASDALTRDICALDPEADPADVHEDVREALWPFFLEIRDRFGVEGDV